MLLGNITIDSTLSDDDYYNLGIDGFTSNAEYNRKFFNILQKLPFYYEKVVCSMNNEERRAALDEVYSEICRSIELRVGSFRETDASGNIVKNYEGTVSWPAWRDVELVIDAHYTTFFDGITDLTKQIKDRQLKEMHSNLNGFSRKKQKR